MAIIAIALWAGLRADGMMMRAALDQALLHAAAPD